MMIVRCKCRRPGCRLCHLAANNRRYAFLRQPGEPGPARLARFDETHLAPGSGGLRFNCSLIDWRGGYLFSYRDGWIGSVRTHVVPLDREFRPTAEPTRLDLTCPASALGSEDGRLFMYGGKLHVAYTGLQANLRAETSQLYARIGDDLRVEEVFACQYPRRRRLEKNWVFFENDGRLYCVYKTWPNFRVLEVNGARCRDAHSTANTTGWSDGEPRGGTPPVLRDGVYHTFFHASTKLQGHMTYNIGYLTFEAGPPFRVLSMTTEPIAWANPRTNFGCNYSVIFPCGAVPYGDGWAVSCGVHDRWGDVLYFPPAVDGLMPAAARPTPPFPGHVGSVGWPLRYVD